MMLRKVKTREHVTWKKNLHAEGNMRIPLLCANECHCPGIGRHPIHQPLTGFHPDIKISYNINQEIKRDDRSKESFKIPTAKIN
jgi:hypothetical protein